MKYFTPVGKIFPAEETIGDRLQRLARASLPVYRETEKNEKKGRRKRRRCAFCGAPLHANAKVRQNYVVCDDCAAVIPYLPRGRQKSEAIKDD
jgi:hypothetical protein